MTPPVRSNPRFRLVVVVLVSCIFLYNLGIELHSESLFVLCIVLSMFITIVGAARWPVTLILLLTVEYLLCPIVSDSAASLLPICVIVCWLIGTLWYYMRLVSRVRCSWTGKGGLHQSGVHGQAKESPKTTIDTGNSDRLC
jgi:hypothetical protein